MPSLMIHVHFTAILYCTYSVREYEDRVQKALAGLREVYENQMQVKYRETETGNIS